MCNVCIICMPQAVADIISSIGIGTTAADSIGYRVPAQYQSNPKQRHTFLEIFLYLCLFCFYHHGADHETWSASDFFFLISWRNKNM